MRVDLVKESESNYVIKVCEWNTGAQWVAQSRWDRSEVTISDRHVHEGDE